MQVSMVRGVTELQLLLLFADLQWRCWNVNGG